MTASSISAWLRHTLSIGAVFLLLAPNETGAQFFSQGLPRRILPYVEAEGTPVSFDTSKVFWITDEHIAFTAHKPGVSPHARLENALELSIAKFEVTDQVLIFDVVTRKSVKHADGWLLRYENGRMTVTLREVRTRNYFRNFDREGSYDIRLEGPLGQETRVHYPLTNDPPRLLKCPTDPGAENGGSNLILNRKAEQGCLYHPKTETTASQNWIYFRSDGARIELDAIARDVGFSRWVEWLGAHVLNTNPNVGMVKPGPDARLILLWPDGRTKELTKNKVYFSSFQSAQNALPTRAGLVVNSPGRDPPRSIDGLFIWRNDDALQLAEGLISTIEVSPNGCKAAFLVRPSSMSVAAERLRIVDLCKAFDVNLDANPFR